MKEFIIEYEIEKVSNPLTRNYLSEVINDYNIGSYRSAIVILNSIVIFDLLGKINILSEIYEDDTAIDIKMKVEQSQKDNPNSPIWEKLLLDQISNRTELLNPIEVKKIQHLIDDRNYCAHPLYDNKYELINPNREQVRSHIRNMLEFVFQKDALLSKKILNDFLHDISDYYKKIGEHGLGQYIENKYLTRFNTVTLLNIFKSLWKFIFILNNPDCQENRTANLNILIYIIKMNKSLCLQKIREDIAFYNNLTPENDDLEPDRYYKAGNSPISSILYLCFHIPEIVELINDTVKTNMKLICEKNASLYLLSYYLFDETPETHFKNAYDKIISFCTESPHWFEAGYYTSIDGELITQIMNDLEERNIENYLLDFCIEYYTKSPTYDSAKYIYYSVIKQVIDKMDIDQTIKMLNEMNDNSQIYDSRDFGNIKIELKESIKRRFKRGINYKTYSNLW